MWNTYSKSYLKQNRASATSVMAAALVATMFLSLLCTLADNLWAYEVATGNAGDVTPLVAVFLLILMLVAFSLALIIRSAFELFMDARVHQFGILSSVGATPRQIRTCLMQEAVVLCAIPIAVGTSLGAVLCYGVMEAVNRFAAGVAGRQDALFRYSAGVLALTLLCSGLTVLVSASAPARKLSKLTPIQAIANAGGLQLKRRKHSRFLSMLFGIEGELAGNALKAQKKALRIANLSLLLSFLAFSMMLCFTTLSYISTRHTYFERYQNAWDVMVTVQDANLAEFDLVEELQALPGVREAAVYQIVEANCYLPEEAQSLELLALGGFERVEGKEPENGQFAVKMPMVILDDATFLAYCRQTGNPETLDGAIVLNQIWDSVNSNFRYKEYIPFVDEDFVSGLGIPILGYGSQAPTLREEYDNYALVHFLSVSLWETLEDQPGTPEADLSVRIFTDGDGSLEDLNGLQASVERLLAPSYGIEIENRVQEQASNDQMIAGMQWIFGFFCVLLALIGIANVFSNTLGFLRSRSREFAQYQSVGMTPEQMKKLFRVEALVIAGKPLLITLPLTVLFVEFAVTASYLDPREFWSEAPVFPILLFAAAIACFVSLAYYLGGKQVMNADLSETLRKDAIL